VATILISTPKSKGEHVPGPPTDLCARQPQPSADKNICRSAENRGLNRISAKVALTSAAN